MKNTGRKYGLLVLIVLLCLWVLTDMGWGFYPVECPPEGCDECEKCDWTTGYECFFECTYDQECCNDECVDECQIVDGESCDGGTVGACFACELFGSCGGNVTRYNGGKEKICSPRGCSCIDDTKVCYTTRQCNPTGHFMPFADCGGVGPGPVGCVEVLPVPSFCFYCFEDDNSEEYHYVDDDSCN